MINMIIFLLQRSKDEDRERCMPWFDINLQSYQANSCIGGKF